MENNFTVEGREIIVKKNELRRNILKNVVQQAEKIVKSPVPFTDYSSFRQYHLSGDRSGYQKPFGEKRRNIVFLAIAAYLTGKEKYILKLQDYIWDICNEQTWSAPAHLPEKLNYEKKYIDLVVSTTAAALAEIYSLLNDKLDENIKNRIVYEIEQRVFIPFYQHPEDYGWFKRYGSNWCAVCCGAIGTALIHTGRGKVYFEKILNNVIESINGYFDHFDTLGGWVEGVSYWNYGITNALKFTDALYRATKGKINLFKHPKIQNTGLFPVHCFLPPDTFVNFGDSVENLALNRETMLLISQHTKYGKNVSWLLKHIRLNDFQDIRSLREIKIPEVLIPEQTFIHFKNIDWAITRKNWKDKNGPVFAIKAGHNEEPHNQIDVGQFIFHVFGEDYLCDYGAGSYTKEYFSPKRYENPFCNAEGHSLIFIDGMSQGLGRNFSGKIIEAKHGELEDEISLDLTGAYPSDLVTKVIRKIKFSKKQKYGHLLISDIVETNTERNIETRIQYNGKLKKLDRKHFVIYGKNGKLALNIIEPEKFNVKTGEFKNLPTLHGERKTMKFLKITSRGTKICFSIEAIPQM